MEKCHTVWDVTVQLEPGSVPQCGSGGGSYTLFTSDSDVSLEFIGVTDPIERLDAALIGEAPPGATFSSLVNTDNVTMTWPTPVAGSYSFAVQFCNRGALCGACSVSINVNDALPRVVLSTTATITDSGVYSFQVLADNNSLDPASQVTVDSVSSSIDGDLSLYGCEIGVVIVQGGQYICTYESAIQDGALENVISIQVSSNGTNGLSSVSGASSTPTLPTLSMTTITTGATGLPTSVSTASADATSNAINAGGSTFLATTSVTTTPAPICGASGASRCTLDSDCGGSDTNQAGLCTASGFCQCGFGYQGVGTVLDPTACEYVCTPPAIPDAVTFLNEPELESFAEDGNLVVRVTVDPFLKQQPATIAMQHPQTGERCGILWERLGMCELSQSVNAGNCWTKYEWQRRWNDVVANSGCFIELPNITESGPGFTLVSRRFRTVFEVAMSGLAPFGLNATRKRQSEVTVQRILRREYTFTIAVRLMVESNPFSVVANGALRYRLVEIDTIPLAGAVKFVVQTRVATGVSVSPMVSNSLVLNPSSIQCFDSTHSSFSESI